VFFSPFRRHLEVFKKEGYDRMARSSSSSAKKLFEARHVLRLFRLFDHSSEYPKKEYDGCCMARLSSTSLERTIGYRHDWRSSRLFDDYL